MRAQEIREAFLDFFADKRHKIVRSSALLPKDDPSILFTNAGMNQFKNVFLGLEKRTYKRAVSVQKCMRVSGKHNDLEQVGKTNKHHTFFEMLGNFSFGDYFKKEAIEFSWQLMTEVFRLPADLLYVTVYKDDEESYQVWQKDIGLSQERIFCFGEQDNYWAMGETGPCGPCSEIHYDLGPAVEKGDPLPLIEKGSDRFLELWNLVFMQYDRDGSGNLNLLPSPSIDTGMGLERLAAVLQQKKSNFDTDLFLPLIDSVCDLCNKEYPLSEEEDASFRIIADHARAITFLIGDGIMPANEGRGYVLRRLIRRAFRHGNFLGVHDPFIYKLISRVVDIMKDAYPELLSSSGFISSVCLSEEKRFSNTLSSGLRTFNRLAAEIQRKKLGSISGKKAFKLYDTFGFPLDLTKELAEERDIVVDEEGFFQELTEQRQRARLSWRGEAKQKEQKIYEALKDISMQFVGYDTNKVPEARVVGLLRKGKEVKQLKEEESGEVFLDRTPFYAEAGGQVGDSGVLKNPHFSGLVETAYLLGPEIIAHKVDVISGKIEINDTVEALINISQRKAISRNHTATHLLHASLRQILGDHVKQSGSLVSPKRLRFDFTHFSSLGSDELRQIENTINDKIRDSLIVETKITSLEDGIKEGAVAIFEEKYREKVRMVSINSFSKELCGGVHVHNTGEIGLFKIISEASIAAGMRRVEALTGEEALKYIQENEDVLSGIQGELNSPREELLEQIEKLKESLKDKEKENRSLRQRLANMKYRKEDDRIQKIHGVSVLIQRVEGLTMTELRELADSLKQKLGSGIVVMGAVEQEKALLVVAVTDDLVNRLKASDLIKKIAPIVGGGGGGRPDFAQAGGTDTGQLDHALEKSRLFMRDMLDTP